eukprot:1151806-Pelagomonas_calceolata.AAC.1
MNSKTSDGCNPLSSHVDLLTMPTTPAASNHPRTIILVITAALPAAPLPLAAIAVAVFLAAAATAAAAASMAASLALACASLTC